MKRNLIPLFLFCILFIYRCDYSFLETKIIRDIKFTEVNIKIPFEFYDKDDIEKLKPSIVINFSKAMNKESVNKNSSIIHHKDEKTVPLVKKWNTKQTTLTITSKEKLAFRSSYTLFIKKQAKDGNMINLEKDFRYSFISDFSRPKVESSHPTDKQYDYPEYNRIRIDFNEMMDKESVFKALGKGDYQGAFKLYTTDQPTIRIKGQGEWAGETFFFNTQENLKLFTLYIIEVSGEAKDLFNNPLETPYNPSFKVFGKYSMHRFFPVKKVCSIDMFKAFDGTYELFILDSDSNGVKVFETNGPVIREWPLAIKNAPFPCQSASCIKLDDSYEIPYVYILSKNEHRILKYDVAGNYYGWFGKGKWFEWNAKEEPLPGIEEGEFYFPESMVIQDEYIYVADTGNNRIQKIEIQAERLKYKSQFGQQGLGQGEFSKPRGISVDNDGNIYIADTENKRIQKMSQDFSFLYMWNTWRDDEREWEFQAPCGIVVENNKYLYIADPENYKVAKFDSKGKWITAWGKKGKGADDFENPVSIVIDGEGKAYVADTGNNRVTVFKQKGGGK